MVESNRNLPAIILVGGGSAFRDTCPVLVEKFKQRDDRQLSVVIIDHDQGDIRHLYDELSEKYPDVEVRRVLLENTALRSAALATIIDSLGLRGITPNTNPADCPPMIRALVHLWSMEICNAVKDVLPGRGIAQLGDAILCSPFSVTGPTSSVVGLEAPPIIIKGLADWRALAPATMSGITTSIGFALVAPDPRIDASPYGLEHGRKVADFLGETMEKDEGPFELCLLLDSSGMGMCQDLASYRQWVAETTATFLTAQLPHKIAPSAPFADSVEIRQNLPEGKSYANLALIRAGCSPEDRQSIDWLIDLCDGRLETPMPRHLQNLDSLPRLETTRQNLLLARQRLAHIINQRNPFGKAKRERDARRHLDGSRTSFGRALGDLIRELRSKWQSRDFSLMWAMPQNPDYLPSSSPSVTPPHLSEMPPEQRRDFTRLLERIMQHCIQPQGNELLRALLIRIIASHRNQNSFPIRENHFDETLLGGNPGTIVYPSDTQDQHLMNYLLMWLPRNGHPTPRYSTLGPAPVIRPLPAVQQAWPDDNFPLYPN
jgi:hypothetical protein